MSETEPWSCPTCQHTVSTPYCPACGERPLHARELTLRGLLDQLARAFTSIDGRLIRSFRCLLGRPGFLTLAYLQGRRKPYVAPIPLFLLANTLFFATEALTGSTVFTTPLDSHLHMQPWSPVAELLVSNRMAVLQTTHDLYAPVFDHAVARNASSLVLLMALSFVAAPSIAFYRSGRPFVVHALFSLHVYAFLLVLLSLATVVPRVDVWLGGPGFASESLDHVISITLLFACAIYLHIATGTVYGAHGALRVVKVSMLTLAVASIVLGYRFALLLITLYST